MPPVVAGALVAGVASGAAAVAAGGGFAVAFGAAFVTTLVAGGISKLLAPSIPAFKNDPLKTGNSVASNISSSSRKIVYGKTRVYNGEIRYMGTSPGDKLLNIVVVLAAHEVEAIDEVYLGDTLSTDSRFTGFTYTETANPISGFKIATGTDNRFGDLVFDNRNGNPAENSIRNWKADTFSDPFTCFEITGTGTGNDGLYRRRLTGSDDLQHQANNEFQLVRLERIDNGQISNQTFTPGAVTLTETYVKVNKYVGTPGQDVSDVLQPLVNDVTVDDNFQGLACVLVSMLYSRSVWPNGPETISAVVRGKKVYDPRSTLTAYSANWALCVNDYLTDQQLGGKVNYAESIDEPELIAAANICDEAVDILPVGTEPRYELNGVIDTATNPGTNLNAMALSGGTVINTGARWLIRPYVYRAPVLSIDDSHIRSTKPIVFRTHMDRSENMTGVKGLFTSRDEDWQPTDYPPQISTTFRDDDGGEDFIASVDQPFTTSQTQAQRLARLLLHRARQQQTVILPLTLQAYDTHPEDTVTLTIDRYGISNKIYRVEQRTLILNPEANDIGVDLVLREEAAASYDWNTGLELAYDLAPNSNLPSPFNLPAPTGLVADSSESQVLKEKDGTLISRIRLSWDQDDYGFVEEWEVAYTNTSTGVTEKARTESKVFYIAPVQDGDIYDIIVCAVGPYGNTSRTCAQVFDHEVIGKTSPPPDVGSLTVGTTTAGLRSFSALYPNRPFDFAGFRIRFQEGFGGTWETMQDLNTFLISHWPWESVEPINEGDYTFGVKAIDTSGFESVNAIIEEITLPVGAVSGVLDVLDFKKEGWPGTKTDCHANRINGNLQPDSTEDWDGLPSPWTSWNNWIETPVGTYVYEHSTVDIGGIVTFNLIPSVASVDTVTVEEQHSDDDVAYTAWAAIVNPIRARYLRIRLTVS